MSARMKQFTLSVLFCLLGSTLTSYGMPDTSPIEKSTAYKLMCQETFMKLREMFPNPILDEDFKTLKQVTGSKVYLDFLKQAYPTEKPFETLNGFMAAQMTAPPLERYETFLNQHFEHLTDADFQSIHLLTLIYRHTDILMTQANQTKDRNAMKKAIMQRIFITRKEPIRTWWQSRISGEKEAKKMAFVLGLDKFATETQKEDTDWIHAQFETHGQANAMLWLAIRKPILIGEILTNFSSPGHFLAWVEQTSILKKLATFETL